MDKILDMDDDHELSRYLARYLFDNQNLFLAFSARDDCDIINVAEIEKVLKTFFHTLP